MPYTPIPDELRAFEAIALDDLEKAKDIMEVVNVTKRVIMKFGLNLFAEEFERYMQQNM